MKWYDIEYSGGKSAKNITGQSNLNLDEVLNTPDPPKFIKIENMSYYSKLSEKYELYEKWDSKWENEIWINTASIISLRKVNDNIHSNPSIGEWNAFPSDNGTSLVISKEFVESLKSDYETVFLYELKKLTNEKYNQHAYYGEFKVSVQELLKKNEIIFNQFGKIVIRKKVEGDISKAIIKELDNHFSKFNQNDNDAK